MVLSQSGVSFLEFKMKEDYDDGKSIMEALKSEDVVGKFDEKT